MYIYVNQNNTHFNTLLVSTMYIVVERVFYYDLSTCNGKFSTKIFQ